jgi:hypothetical protein
VLGVHLWLAERHWPTRLGEGAGQDTIRPMDVAFVRTLAPAAAPARAVVGVSPARRGAAAAATAPPLPEPAASQAAFAELAAPASSEPNPPAVSLTHTDLPMAAALEAAPPLAALPELPNLGAALPPSSVPFDWPPSTRIAYRLQGHYRGPVEGQAKVEWLRSGSRYQVLLDVHIGPSFAPLVSRRVISEGEIGPDGLHPRRFEETTKAVLREPFRRLIELGEHTIRMPDGRELPRPKGVQDSASQFVQMTWLFTTQPQLLTPGTRIDFPLALPRHVQVWTFAMLASEPVPTPAGPLPVVHVKPQREAKAGDLTAEFWVAPNLQNLPVRILIRQDAETYIDLQIDKLPEQAATPTFTPTPAPVSKPTAEQRR